MTVSIIIAAKTWQKNLKECVDSCLKLDFADFEILILPDEPLDKSNFKIGTVPVTIIPTGHLSPARKRDIALNHAKGQILAFLDDDAYPKNDWLKNAVVDFEDDDVAAIGGSAVTPPDDNLRQKASGIIYSSFLVSAKFAYRYIPKKKIQVDDFPTCNLLVRKSAMQQLGGFNTDFWPGEDTKLCLDITRKLGKKIIYDPKVLVYHHRRPLFLAHLRQVASYALHRGYFVKRYPGTSCKVAYFVPTLFVLTVVTVGILSIFLAPLRVIYFFGLFLYLLLVFIFSISNELQLTALVFSGIILTHFIYGIYFLKGLISPRLEDKL